MVRMNVNAIVFVRTPDPLPDRERFNFALRENRIHQTIARLSSIIPRLAERVFSMTIIPSTFSVQLTTDEFSDLDQHFSGMGKDLGFVRIKTDKLRPAR